jgi:hypothetical protein
MAGEEGGYVVLGKPGRVPLCTRVTFRSRTASEAATRTAAKVTVELAAWREFVALGVEFAAVEAGTPLGVRQQIVGVVQFREPVGGLLIARVQIRVMALRQLAIGGLDRRLVRGSIQAQNLVGVSHGLAS